MKKLLTIAMMTAAVSALAVESSNTFGILRVDSTDAQTIVAVPWAAAGGGNINIKDVVKTANLTEGDTLYYYDGSDFKMWQLGASGWDIAQDAQGNKPNAELARGGAIILVRQRPEVGSFYLYGQYVDDSVSAPTTTIGVGKQLVAPPKTEMTDINSLNWTGVATGDMIYVRNTKQGGVSPIAILTYNGTTWGYRAKVNSVWTWCTDMSTVPAGEGFWYVRAEGSEAMTLSWAPKAQNN